MALHTRLTYEMRPQLEDTKEFDLCMLRIKYEFCSLQKWQADRQWQTAKFVVNRQ